MISAQITPPSSGSGTACRTTSRPVTAYLFSRGDPSDKDANGDHLGIGGTHRGTGRLIFFNGNTQQELLVGQTELKLKHWHHVVLVREGTRVTVYLDGNPEPDICRLGQDVLM